MALFVALRTKGRANCVGNELKCNSAASLIARAHAQGGQRGGVAAFALAVRLRWASDGGEACEEGVGVGDDVGVCDGERGFEREFR